MADENLDSILEYFLDREKRVLLKGIRASDRNFPEREMVVLNSAEYYSILRDDLLPKQKQQSSTLSECWVKNDAEVWHCKKMTLSGPNTISVLPDTISALQLTSTPIELPELAGSATPLGCCTLSIPGGPDRQIAGVSERECKRKAKEIGGVGRWKSGDCFSK